jgi:hypothetical protein
MDLGLVVLGMDVGLHVSFSSDAVRAGRLPSRWSPALWCVGQAGVAGASTASAASTRIRFFVLVACSNLTLPVTVAKTV